MRRILWRTLKIVLLAIFLFMAIVPLYWVIVTSLKGTKELYAYPVKYLPASFNLQNYRDLFRISHFSVFFRNSLMVSLIASAGALSVSALSGYALSRFTRQRMKMVLLLVMYFSQMIPTFMIMAPLFTSLARIGMTDRLYALTVVYVATVTAFSTIMAKSFFDRVPPSLEEAALIDGCTRMQTIFKMVLPLSLPGLAAIYSFCFVNIWNELFLAVMLMSSNDNMTVPVALNSFICKAGVSWGVLSAGIVIALLPTMIVFAFAQKYIIMGLTEGAVKG